MKLPVPLFLVLGVFASACGDDSSLKGVKAESVPLDQGGGTGKTGDCTSTSPRTGAGSTTGAAESPTPGQNPSTSDSTSSSSSTTSDPGPGGVIPLPRSKECIGVKNGTICGNYMVCLHERCMISLCGDGLLMTEFGEECEDGNTEDFDGCSACVIERCGDGVIHPGEECDDGNSIRDDGCNNVCKRTEKNLCGNGKLDPGEQCDDANTDNTDACRNDCRLAPGPACGNKKIDNGEECDDGNHKELDGCGPNCQIEVCGDGFIRSVTEQCDDGNLVDGDGCSSACRAEGKVCGNGIVEAGEDCDDGNNRNNDACPNDCQAAVCGDGVREGLETCDDANIVTGDGCSVFCQQEVLCGNGTVEFAVGGEQCDDGNKNNYDRCPNDCQVAVCGDGVRDGFEPCDGTDIEDARQVCDDKCQIKPVCGNGIVETSKVYPSEVCDDGNTEDGDVCNADCMGLNTKLCGNGTVEASVGEECDYGEDNDEPGGLWGACHNCKWTFFNKKCSDCMARSATVADKELVLSEDGSVITPGICSMASESPCRIVMQCFAEKRCTSHPGHPNPAKNGLIMGPFDCLCDDLTVAECQKNKTPTGVCLDVARPYIYQPDDRKRRPLSPGNGAYLNALMHQKVAAGSAMQAMIAMARNCASECAEFLRP